MVQCRKNNIMGCYVLKKTLCIILSITLLITTFINSFADDFGIDKLKMNEAVAYGEVLSDITSRLEAASSDGNYTLSFKSQMPYGLSYANLVDFDGSLVPELFVFYISDSKYNYEVWTLDSYGYALQLASKGFELKSDKQSEETVYLADHGDSSDLVLYKKGVDGLEERILVYSLNGGSWENTKTYERSVVTRENSSGEEADYAKCILKANGSEKEITINEYDAIRGVYVNDSLEELYKYNSENDELYVNKLKTDVNQAEKLSELASKINGFVNSMQNKAIEEYSYEDIFSSLSSDERSYLTELLTYFSGSPLKGNVNLSNSYNDVTDYVAYKASKDNAIKKYSSTESEEFVLVDKKEVDAQIFKRLGLYPSEEFYNDNSENGNFTRDGYYHLKDETFTYDKNSYQPQKMHKISDTTYLVTFNVYTWDKSSPQYKSADVNLYIDEWDDKVKEGATYNNNGYAIVEKAPYSEYPYFIREMKVGSIYPSEEYLEKYAYLKQETLLDFNYQLTEPTLEAFVNEIEDELLILDVLVSFTDLEKIVEYTEYAVESLGSVSVRSQNSTVNLSTIAIEKSSKAIKDASEKFDALLNTYNIKLSREYKKIAKVFVSNVTDKKSITVDLSKDLLKLDADSVKFVFSNDNYYMQIDKKDLEEIIKENQTTLVKITRNNDDYKIEFVAGGRNLDKLNGKIKLSFPATNSMSTVYLYRDEYDVHIGGQYNPISGGANSGGGIETYIKYSGQYILENGENKISDIKLLNVTEADIVKFMVSKNIMSVTDGAFNPQLPLTKKELAKALVNICCNYNAESESDFIDVKDDDLYYPYISSAFENGYFDKGENGLFEPDKPVTREELLKVISEILIYEKGYILPVRSTSESFVDYETVTGWDMQDAYLALVASLGIIDEGGLLRPQSEMSRLDAALVLYRFNNVINGVPSAVTFTNANVISQYGWIIAVLVFIVIIAAITVATVIVVKRKKKSKNNV